MNNSGLFCTTFYSDNTWYREWNNSLGQRVYLEQGGFSASTGSVNITFPKAFNFKVLTVSRGVYLLSGGGGTNHNSLHEMMGHGVTLSGFTYGGGGYYYACGI